MNDTAAMPTWVKRALLGFWIGALALWYVIGAVRSLGNLLLVLLVSVFVAFAIEPAVNRFEQYGMRRGLATGLTFVLVLVMFTTFFALVGTALATQVSELVEKAPGYIADIESWINSTFNTSVSFQQLQEEFLEGGGLQDLAGRFADDLVNLGASIVSLLFDVFTGALFTFFLAAEGPKLRRAIVRAFSKKHSDVIINIWEVAMSKTAGYIYSRLLLAALSALVHWLFFWLLGVPSPVALALWVGVISQFIPAIGTYIAGVLPVVVAIVHEPITGLWVLLVILVYQQIENYVLSPRITAQTMEIHVAIAFGSVIAGNALLGIIGALLALPAAATIQGLLSSWVDQRAERRTAAEAAEAQLEGG